MKPHNKIYALSAFALIAILSCKKHNTPAPAPTPQSYAVNMGGARVWHGSQRHICDSCVPVVDSTYNVENVFAITVIDTSVIAIPYTSCTACDTMFFSSADTTYNSITFTPVSGNPYYTGYITYYYLKDSLVYQTTVSDTYESLLTNLSAQ